MPLRPETTVPDTGKKTSADQFNAEVAHESTLRDFAINHTELSVLDKDQMGVIALVSAGQRLGLQLPATSEFFERIRQLSSGEEGKGRVQAKECITAGAFPMSLLFPQEKTSLWDTLKGFVGRGKTDTPQQKAM
jgi:hypothetical protein